MTTCNIKSRDDLERFLRLVSGTETTEQRDERVRRTYGTRLIHERERDERIENVRTEVVL